VECKLGYVNFRRVSDYRRALRPAFRVTEISDDWYRSTMGVIVISLGTPQCAGENIGCTWESCRQVWEYLESPLSSRGKTSSLEMLQVCLECCRCAWNAAGAPGILQVRLEIIATTYRSTIVKTHVFRLYSHLCNYVSIYLCIYIATHLHTIYLDWLQAVLESNSSCA